MKKAAESPVAPAESIPQRLSSLSGYIINIIGIIKNINTYAVNKLICNIFL